MADDNVVVIDVAARFSDQTQPGMNSAQKNVDKFSQSIQKEQKQVDSFNRTKAQIRLEAKDAASKIIKDVSTSAGNLAKRTISIPIKAADYATKPLRSVFNFATSIQGILTGAGIGLAFNKLINAPVALADSFTTAQIGFNTMLGSASAGAKMMKDIQSFAIATPFSTTDVIQNTQMMMAYGFQAKDVIKDMKIIGDQAAATGKGSEGLQSIALALGQMSAHGKVDAQDMNQLTSVGVKGWDYLAQAMGKTKAQVMDLSQNGKISSAFGVQAILNGMKEYNGMMEKTANTTVSGLKSQIADTFSIDILTKWGQGLQKGMVGNLSKFNDWLGKNQTKIAKWGDALEGIGTIISMDLSRKTQGFTDLIDHTFNGSAFRNATTLSGKLHVAWEDVIAQPFDKWWSGSGEKWLAGKAAGIGRGLGGGITNGVLGILGVTVTGASSDGQSVGSAFAKGFSESFNGSKIAEAFKTSFSKVLSDAKTTLPGGQSSSSTGWMSDALLGYLGIKGLKGGLTVAKGVKGAASGMGDFAGSAKKLLGKGASAVESAAGAVTMSANVVYLSGQVLGGSSSNFVSDAGSLAGDFGGLKAGGSAERALTEGAETAGSLSKVGKFAEAASKFGKAAPIIGTALAVAGGAIEVAAAPKSQKLRTGIGAGGNVAGGLAGAWAGAQLGALTGGAIGSVIPGAGTAAGAAIGGAVGTVAGGIAGAIGGQKVATGIYDRRDAIAKGAQKLFSAPARKEAGKGAAAGAAIGTVFAPGIGTAVGGTVGAAMGALDSAFGGSAVGKWASSIEKSVGDFFTKTIPSAATSVGSAIGGFFTNTLPGIGKTVASGIGNFVTKTIPGAIQRAGAAVGNFFSSLPYEAGRELGREAGRVQKFIFQTVPQVAAAVGNFFTGTVVPAAKAFASSVGNFFTKTIPQAVAAVGAALGNFFTKTLPDAAWAVATSVGNFVTKTLPRAAVAVGAALGNFFTQTLPNFATSVVIGIGTFFTKTLPTAAAAVSAALGTFFTQTVPNFAQTVLSSVGTFITKTIPNAASAIGSAVGNFFTQTLPNAVGNALSSAGEWFEKNWSKFTAGAKEGYGETSAHANGGFFNKPHVGLVAEDGPEGIIPLSAGKRSRGLALWEQAGRMMGVRPYAEGGIVGRVIPMPTPRAAVQSPAHSPQISVQVTLGDIYINGKTGSDGTLDKKALAKEISDVVAGEISKNLERVFSNMPMESIG